METRINKYLSEAGYCSRREADRLLEEGRITINGRVPEIGTKVTFGDVVKVDGKPIRKNQEFTYLIYNKPIGVTSTTDQTDPTNIVDAIGYKERIFHIGRLDKDSEGLIIMTNDGDIVNKILRTENNHEKEYIVTVHKPVTKKFLHEMATGVPILDTVTKPCKVKKLGVHTFSITLTEGLNRQIRRMCSYFEYRVMNLKRIRIMHLPLDIDTGEYRELTLEEEKTLKKMVRESRK